MLVTKDRPHGSGRSVLMFSVVECEDHSAIQAPWAFRVYTYIVGSFAQPLLGSNLALLVEPGYGEPYSPRKMIDFAH